MGGESILYWHWWAFGVVLLILEMVAPASFFLWMAVSAGVVGLVLLLFGSMSFNYQLLLFAGVAFVAIAAFHMYRKKNPHDAEGGSRLNQRETQYLGLTFTLDQPIVGGVGKLRIDDTIWRIEGVDMGAGARVKVVGSRGNALLVERA